MAKCLSRLLQFILLQSKCINELFGIKVGIELSSKTADNRAKNILQYNLNSTFGKIKQNEAIKLLKQYYSSYKNQIVFIESLKLKVAFTFQFWIRLLMPKISDYSVTRIPTALWALYLFVRANRMLKRIFKRAKT